MARTRPTRGAPPPPRALLLSGAILFTGACGPGAATPPPAAPPEPAATATAAAPPPVPPPAPIVAGAVPGDAEIYGEISGVKGLVASARSSFGPKGAKEAYRALAEELDVQIETAEKLVGAIESIHLGGRRVGKSLEVEVGIVLSDSEPIRHLLAVDAVSDQGALGPYGRKLRVRKDKQDLVWFEAPRLLIAGDEAMLEAVAAVVEGRAPGRTEEQRGGKTDRRAFVSVSPAVLDDLGEGRVKFTGPLSVVYELWEGGIRGAYRAGIVRHGGESALTAIPPRALSLARSLPAETAAYLALSTGIAGGPKGAERLLGEVVAAAGGDGEAAVKGADAALSAAGLHLADLLGSLGGEGVLGVAVRPGVASYKDARDGTAILLVQELSDPKPAERLVKLARAKLTSVHKETKVKAEPGGFSADLRDAPVAALRARIVRGKLFVGAGPRDLLDHAALALDKGKGALGDDAAHARAISGMPPNAQLRLWIDLARVAELAATSSPPAQRALLDAWRETASGPKRLTSALSLSAVPEGDRVRLELDEVNGIGAFAALGVFGVRRYLVSAKVAEARNSVRALARAAVAAYERESLGPGNTVTHTLCRTAQPVPAVVPAGKKYMPSSQPGADFDAGDQATGWKCLRFALVEPHYYQYTYIAGGPYKGPKRGGPDPGPNGFEVAAEGDLDGNGRTSLFTVTGQVDANGNITLSPTFVDHETE